MKTKIKRTLIIASVIIVTFLVTFFIFAQDALESMFFTGGRVGIGTESPREKLDVNGRIMDQTGFIMPVGTILSYLGDTAPTGWFLCNGDEVSRDAGGGELFALLEETYGAGDGLTTFNLPDLRGQFLRGLDTSGTVDPDGGSRSIGSNQEDQFKSHYHRLAKKEGSTSDKLGGSTANYGINQNGDNTTNGEFPYAVGSTGGNETRPKNVAVNFIIKY